MESLRGQWGAGVAPYKVMSDSWYRIWVGQADDRQGQSTVCKTLQGGSHLRNLRDLRTVLSVGHPGVLGSRWNEAVHLVGTGVWQTASSLVGLVR